MSERAEVKSFSKRRCYPRALVLGAAPMNANKLPAYVAYAA